MKIVAYQDLTKDELYDLLALRTAVFVVEQDCPYQELDGIDKQAFHLVYYLQSRLVATLRIYTDEKYIHIGRVVVDKAFRKKNIGIMIMQKALVFCSAQKQNLPVHISSQQYLHDFYVNLGFVPTGKKYLEDGIPHEEMVFNQNS